MQVRGQNLHPANEGMRPFAPTPLPDPANQYRQQLRRTILPVSTPSQSKNEMQPPSQDTLLGKRPHTDGDEGQPRTHSRVVPGDGECTFISADPPTGMTGASLDGAIADQVNALGKTISLIRNSQGMSFRHLLHNIPPTSYIC